MAYSTVTVVSSEVCWYVLQKVVVCMSGVVRVSARRRLSQVSAHSVPLYRAAHSSEDFCGTDLAPSMGQRTVSHIYF